MKILISPAKSMMPISASFSTKNSVPEFLENSLELVSVLKKWSISEFKIKMKISEAITNSTYKLYNEWDSNNISNGIPSIFLYSGTAFKGLAVSEMNLEEVNYANDHLFILSGLYGILRPLDIIHPYRLEMALKFKISKGVDTLYDFWRNEISNFLNRNTKKEIIVNLASNEYFKVLRNKMNSPILNCHFLENKNGKERVIASHAKMARGLMANFIIKNKIENEIQLRNFNTNGYEYISAISTQNEYYFSRIH